MKTKKKREDVKRVSVPIKITKTVMESIAATVGKKRPETGGILGGDRETGIISHYTFDKSAAVTGATYSPDCNSLNHLLKKQWNPEGVRFMGFVHSHPGTFSELSGGDHVYAKKLLEANEGLDRIILPVLIFKEYREGIFSNTNIHHSKDGYELHFYEAFLDGEKLKAQPISFEIVETEAPVQQVEEADYFARVKTAYDLQRMSETRLVVVGCGGSACWVEEMARAGIGQFVLIDPDIVSATNIGTQQYYCDEVGEFKVEALKKRIHRINPNCQVLTLKQKVEDIEDGMSLLLHEGQLPDCCGVKFPFTTDAERVILAGLTDSFEAQSLVHQWAEEYQLPSICAQLMKEGMMLELTFTHPEVTKACHRCILEKRYEYFENGGENGVGSSGTPIFATTRINSLKGMITLALIHHGTDHPRFGGMLNKIGQRNLVLVRFSDQLEELGVTSFDKAFKNADSSRLFIDETIWAPVSKNDSCPLCGQEELEEAS